MTRNELDPKPRQIAIQPFRTRLLEILPFLAALSFAWFVGSAPQTEATVPPEPPTLSEASAPPAAATPPTIAPEELRRGQKGHGFSVFAGREPQRFEVEILGVLRNFTPELTYILARLSGHDLERSGVIAGMSGSPVYVEGRLAGAVSFSYLFGLDAIAGITPIGPMRRLSAARPGAPINDGRAALPTSPAGLVTASSPVAFEDLVRRVFAADLLEQRLEILRPPLPEGAVSTFSWSASGLGEQARALLGGVLGPLAPGGGAGRLAAVAAAGGSDTDWQADLVPGSSVAMVMVEGDLGLAGHGTVTERRGDQVIALGHPMFGLGPVAMPMAPSEVVTVIASRSNSFKLANAGAVVGTFSQDREAGVFGTIGDLPRMVPVEVRLRGLSESDYRMRVIDMPLLTPSLIAVSALGALDAASFSVGNQTLEMRARFELAGHEDLEIRQSFSGVQAGGDSIVYLLGFASYLSLNELERVDIERVEVEYVQKARPLLATITGGHAARAKVRPGETVAIFLDLQTWRGGVERRKLEIEIPPDMPEGRSILFVGDGTTMDGLRLSVEQRAPQVFDRVLDYLNSLGPRDEITVFGLIARPGLSVAGEVMPSLPGSVRSIFAGNPSSGVPLSLAIAFEETFPEERPYQGFARIDLEIEQ